MAIPATTEILAINAQGELNVWDMTNGKLVRTVRKFPQAAFLQGISNDGKRVLVERNGSSWYYPVDEVWDIEGVRLIHRWPSPENRREHRDHLMLTPDGKRLFMVYTPDGQPQRVCGMGCGHGQ